MYGQLNHCQRSPQGHFSLSQLPNLLPIPQHRCFVLSALMHVKTHTISSF
jgi:hypothetical protein